MNGIKRFVLVMIFVHAFLALAGCTPADPYRLSAPGAYDFGTHQVSFPYPEHMEGELTITIRYPAVLPPDAPPSDYYYDAEPDRSKAPYPIVLSSAKSASIFGPLLATHGLISVGVNGQDSQDVAGKWLLDYPREILFALNQISSQPLAGLEGMFDTERAGAMGYSFDSYTTLALGGARIDPAALNEFCNQASMISPPVTQLYIDYNCWPLKIWDELAARAGQAADQDELWKPITDDRILAVMPMAPEGA